jgi:hypothetical protein
MIAKLIFAGAAAALSTASGAFATTYDYTLLKVPGTKFTQPLGINDSGAVTGEYESGTSFLGFVYSSGTYTKLHFPPGSSGDTVGEQINDSGVVVGDGGDSRAFIYSGGAYTEIHYPKSIITGASGINESGVVAGSYRNRSDFTIGYEDSDGTYTQIKYPKSENTSVTGINEADEVAGYYWKGSIEHVSGFIYSGGTYTRIEFPKSSSTYVEAINTSGAVAGYYETGTGMEYGFEESGGTYTRVRFPGSIETNATAINASGVVAGDYEKGPKDKEFGFVYSGGSYATINVPGSTGTYVTGINGSGEVTGYYDKGSALFGFIATPQSGTVSVTSSTAAPEPSTWAMLLSGFAGLGLVGYRKARTKRMALSVG